jgi:hypothetical protein
MRRVRASPELRAIEPVPTVPLAGHVNACGLVVGVGVGVAVTLGCGDGDDPPPPPQAESRRAAVRVRAAAACVVVEGFIVEWVRFPSAR